MNKLLKISFAFSLFGVLVLLFISNRAEPELINIENITETYMNRQVKIIGEMKSVRNYDEEQFQVLTIKDITGEIDVTSNSKTPLNKTGDGVRLLVIGKVQEYRGELQISADKIIKIND